MVHPTGKSLKTPLSTIPVPVTPEWVLSYYSPEPPAIPSRVSTLSDLEQMYAYYDL